MSKDIEIPKLECRGCIARDGIIRSLAEKNSELENLVDTGNLTEIPQIDIETDTEKSMKNERQAVIEKAREFTIGPSGVTPWRRRELELMAEDGLPEENYEWYLCTFRDGRWHEPGVPEAPYASGVGETE